MTPIDAAPTSLTIAIADHNTKPGMTTERNPRWATLIDPQGNFYRITDHLYRSEQPLKPSAVQLHALGIHTVISFRAFHSDEKILRDTGITLKRIPMHTWHVEDDDVVQALLDIRHAEQAGPVLIHCQHGADRTGLVSAMYRMVYQNWTREEALDELQNGGYGFHSMWRNIPRYLRKVNLEVIRVRVQGQR
jgi:protein tyrosine/serine phosphatase